MATFTKVRDTVDDLISIYSYMDPKTQGAGEASSRLWWGQTQDASGSLPAWTTHNTARITPHSFSVLLVLFLLSLTFFGQIGRKY